MAPLQMKSELLQTSSLKLPEYRYYLLKLSLNPSCPSSPQTPSFQGKEKYPLIEETSSLVISSED